MSAKHERNLAIWWRWRRGDKSAEIADEFGIRPQRVVEVARYMQKEHDLVTRGRELVERIGKCDDLDREWEPDDIIDMLTAGMPVRVRNAVGYVFVRSLRDLLDLVAPGANDRRRRVGYISPILGKRNFGVAALAMVIRRMSDLNLGPAFRREWTARKVWYKDEVEREGTALERQIVETGALD